MTSHSDAKKAYLALAECVDVAFTLLDEDVPEFPEDVQSDLESHFDPDLVDELLWLTGRSDLETFHDRMENPDVAAEAAAERITSTSSPPESTRKLFDRLIDQAEYWVFVIDRAIVHGEGDGDVDIATLQDRHKDVLRLIRQAAIGRDAITPE